MPLTLRNSGDNVWDAGRVHLSYHWLWFVPREFAKRSRTVPYHDGIRTELTLPVPPGATASVEGRLLAPDFPGVYWLQWDMVAEGITWFAQVSPRQPRRLVVVLPTPAGVAAPLPLIVALVGALTLSRGRRRPLDAAAGIGRSVASIAAASGDVIWCGVALVVKSLILAREALLEPTATAYWLTVLTAIAVPLIVAVASPRRARRWVLFAVGAFCSVLLLGDALYYRFFGDVLSVSAMLAVRQTGQVSGTIRSLVTPAMVWLLIDLPFAAWLVTAVSRQRPAGRVRRLMSAAVVGLFVLVAAIPPLMALRQAPLEQMFRDRAMMEQLGPLGYHAYDAWTFAESTLFRPPLSDAELSDVQAWFAARASLRAGAGAAFGAARGKNLIVIQVESLQDFVVDYEIAGQSVMPHLRAWTSEGLRFTDVTDQTNQGRTSDAEFTTMASLLPLDHGAVAFRYPRGRYVGLPEVLTEHGYSTLSAVAFDAGFWNRRVMHPAYGFEQSLFEPDFTLTEQIGWGLNDRDFLQQMVPRLERLSRPFGAWLITLSLHHPFDDFPDRHKVLRIGQFEGTPFGNYLHTMRFFDTALADFESALARSGLLDDTAVVVFGDHDAGFARDARLSAAIGIDADEVSWALNDRIPWFVRLPHAAASGLRGRREMPAGQTDMAPTLLALLGIDASPLPYVGRNLLGQPGDSPVVRPYGDWIDRTHLLINGSGAGGRTCYEIARHAAVDATACAAADADARRARATAERVVTNGLQQKLRERLR